MNFGLVRRNPDWDLIGCVWHFGGCVVPGRAAGSPERQVKSLPRVLILPVLLASFCCFIGKRISESHALINICVSTLSAPASSTSIQCTSIEQCESWTIHEIMPTCPLLLLPQNLLPKPATYQDTVHRLMERFYYSCWRDFTFIWRKLFFMET